MNILIVDDDPGVRNLLTEFISELNYSFQASASGEEALAEFAKAEYNMLFLDLQLPGLDGFEVLRQIKEINNDCEVIIITAYGSVNSAIQALNMGAYAYINKPFDMLELERIIDRVKELIDLRHAYRLLAKERMRSFHFENLVAVSPAMCAVKKQVVELSEMGFPLLIVGEPGSGKRFVSRIIHFNGKSKESLLIQMNVEDIDSLLSKGVFKHSDGITISLNDFLGDLIRQGYGTVVLNHINNLSQQSMDELFRLLNQKLSLQLLEEKYPGFRVIGLLETPFGFANPEILLTDALWGYFNGVITIPALRERSECIVPLAQIMLQGHVAEKGGRNFYISQPVREFLRLYDWPGNINELKSVIDRIASICTSRLISAKDLQVVQKEHFERSGRPTTELNSIITQAEKSLMNKTFRQKSMG